MAGGRLLTIKFDGGDADHHQIGMQPLGKALIGIDRIAVTGILAIDGRRAPKRGDHSPLIIKVKEPTRGSYEIVAKISEKLGDLALSAKLFHENGGYVLVHFISSVLKHFGGRKKAADASLDAILQLHRDGLEYRDRSEQRLVDELGRFREALVSTLPLLGRASIDAVAPIGPSATSLTFSATQTAKVIVDEPMADAIRSKGQLEIGELQTIALATDGWVYHTRTLTVHHPKIPGKFIPAKVKDPLAEMEPNPYANAARLKATIQVRAKPAYEGRMLKAIYIMDYIET